MRIINLAMGLTLATCLGCGPIVSGVQILNADVALSAAETAGAKRQAVYEFMMASAYLEKAREEAGYADYAISRDYADKAMEFALKARKLSEAPLAREPAQVKPR